MPKSPPSSLTPVPATQADIALIRAQRDAVADARWREALRGAYSSVTELVEAGYISAAEMPALQKVAERYRLRIPQYYAALMNRDQPNSCPIRAQALPHINECNPVWPNWAVTLSQQAFGRDHPWTADAIGDVTQLAAPRLTHRYSNRALLHVTTACAVYCRFCFRKAHLNSGEAALYEGSLQPALDYVASHPKIHELILTGGDPLSMTDGWLQRLIQAVEALPHVHTLRLHTRMPVTLPQRLTARLARILATIRLHVVVVSHFNHPRELTKTARHALRRLQRRGVTQLNQAVLLAGINDRVVTLTRLFEGLYAEGVLPYYLHQADWTPDTFHFRVSIARGRRLMAALMGRLSGPAVPRYVVDTPGGRGKVDLMDARVHCLHHQADASMGGALWRLPLPATRTGVGRTALYADFWRHPKHRG